MAVFLKQATSTTPALIADGSKHTVGFEWAIKNVGSKTVQITVAAAASTGYPLAAGEAIKVRGKGDQLWALSAEASEVVVLGTAT